MGRERKCMYDQRWGVEALSAEGCDRFSSFLFSKIKRLVETNGQQADKAL